MRQLLPMWGLEKRHKKHTFLISKTFTFRERWDGSKMFFVQPIILPKSRIVQPKPNSATGFKVCGLTVSQNIYDGNRTKYRQWTLKNNQFFDTFYPSPLLLVFNFTIWYYNTMKLSITIQKTVPSVIALCVDDFYVGRW